VSKSRAKKKQRRRSRAAAVSTSTPAAERAAARTRERGAGSGAEPSASTRAPAPRRPSRLEVRDGVPRPDAVWAPFPLTEIGMAVGLVLFLVGFVGSAPAVFVAGVGVLVVVVCELCLREHLSGFRSHSILLGLLPVTVVHLGIVYGGVATWRGPVALALDLLVAGALAWWLQRRFVIAQGRARL
jgi:hypothetical protein